MHTNEGDPKTAFKKYTYNICLANVVAKKNGFEINKDHPGAAHIASAGVKLP